MENNLTHNKAGSNKLPDRLKELDTKISEHIPSMDEFQEKFDQCTTNECKKEVREEYYKASELGDQKILELYESGELSKEDIKDLVSHYRDAMMKGASEGEKRWENNPSTLSTLEWANTISNSALNAIHEAILIDEMIANGDSPRKIQDAIQRNELLSGALSTIDYVDIQKALDTGDIAKLVAGAIVGKAVSPSGKGSAIPYKDPVVSSNGLSYKSNPKHTLGEQGNRPNAGIEPKNSLELFNDSVVSGKKRYAKDSDGNLHQFTNANDGTWHWAGSTGQGKNSLKPNDVPHDIKKKFDMPMKGKWDK